MGVNQESYVRYGKWITSTLLKFIWDKVDAFKITIEIPPLPIEPLREGNNWFMQAAIEAVMTDPNEQSILNCLRCHQQVLYVFNVLDAGGRCIDK
jgi:hypothetical protein